MTNTSIPENPRSLWPMAIAAFFIVAILGIATFITFAVRQNTDLVRKDYYAEELQFQSRLDQMNRTQNLNLKPEISYDRTRDLVVVSLPNRLSSAQGKIQFYRPSDAALDKNVKLSLNKDGAQEIDARDFSTGLWKVRLHWTANDKEFFSEETIVINRS